MHHALKAVRGMPRDEGMHVASLPPFDCRGKRGDEGGEEGDEEEEEEVSWGDGGGGGSAGEGVENGREGRDGGGVIYLRYLPRALPRRRWAKRRQRRRWRYPDASVEPKRSCVSRFPNSPWPAWRAPIKLALS